MQPITVEQWKSLHPKSQWDVTVALRGPDVIGGEVLKWYTTAVLRAAVEGVVRPEGGSAAINRKMDFIILTHFGGYMSEKQKPLVSFDASHFLQHVGEAAGILDISCLMLPGNIFWEGMKMSSIEQAAGHFARWLEACLSGPSTTVSRKLTNQFQFLKELSGPFFTAPAEAPPSIEKKTKPWKSILEGIPTPPSPNGIIAFPPDAQS